MKTWKHTLYEGLVTKMMMSSSTVIEISVPFIIPLGYLVAASKLVEGTKNILVTRKRLMRRTHLARKCKCKMQKPGRRIIYNKS